METTFTDGVIKQIAETIGTRTPETGGALFGPDDSNLVSHFVFDDKARTTAVTYTPSTDLITRIPKIERRESIVFKGVIHSHPPALDHPSGPDLLAFKRTLDINPQLRSLSAPIVNLGGGSSRDDAYQLNADATMRVFQVFRSPNAKTVNCEPGRVCVMAIDALMQFIGDAFKHEIGSDIETGSDHERLNGHTFLRRRFQTNTKLKKTVLVELYFPMQFPLLAPLVSSGTAAVRRWHTINWNPDQHKLDRLAQPIINALKPHLEQNKETSDDTPTKLGRAA